MCQKWHNLDYKKTETVADWQPFRFFVFGGDGENHIPDLLNAIQALFQYMQKNSISIFAYC